MLTAPPRPGKAAGGAVFEEPKIPQEHVRRLLLFLIGDVPTDWDPVIGGRSPGFLPGRGREAGVPGSPGPSS